MDKNKLRELYLKTLEILLVKKIILLTTYWAVSVLGLCLSLFYLLRTVEFYMVHFNLPMNDQTAYVVALFYIVAWIVLITLVIKFIQLRTKENG